METSIFLQQGSVTEGELCNAAVGIRVLLQIIFLSCSDDLSNHPESAVFNLSLIGIHQ